MELMGPFLMLFTFPGMMLRALIFTFYVG
jgi:hypothetical protein